MLYGRGPAPTREAQGGAAFRYTTPDGLVTKKQHGLLSGLRAFARVFFFEAHSTRKIPKKEPLTGFFIFQS
jgi:hypothetical protein